MNYIQFRLRLRDFESISEITSALLSEHGFEGFIEDSPILIAFISEEAFDNEGLESVLNHPFLTAQIIDLEKEIIEEKNWNALWESDFKPVLLPGICAIIAPFHDRPENLLSLVVEPKMSFGTGHHETTRLMIEALSGIDLAGMSLLDMGAGTGILGIYALKRNASLVYSVDMDDWAVSNCRENFELNQIPANRYQIIKADHPDKTGAPSPDIILANINRNVLLQQMASYSRLLRKEGILLLSGIYEEDGKLIIQEAGYNGLSFVTVFKENKWICLKFIKY